jgi:hypothetical protein
MVTNIYLLFTSGCYLSINIKFLIEGTEALPLKFKVKPRNYLSHTGSIF